VAVVAVILLALLLFIRKKKAAEPQHSTHYDYLKAASYITRDNKQLLMSFNVSWHVADAAVFAKSSPGNSITLAPLNRMIYSAGAEVVGLHNLSEFVNPDGSKTSLGTIEKTLQTSIEGKLDKNNGIVIESVGINSVKQP